MKENVSDKVNKIEFIYEYYSVNSLCASMHMALAQAIVWTSIYIFIIHFLHPFLSGVDIGMVSLLFIRAFYSSNFIFPYYTLHLYVYGQWKKTYWVCISELKTFFF